MGEARGVSHSVDKQNLGITEVGRDDVMLRRVLPGSVSELRCLSFSLTGWQKTPISTTSM